MGADLRDPLADLDDVSDPSQSATSGHRQAARSLEIGSSPLRAWPGNIEDLIHHLCARGDDRAKLAPVHRFRDAR
jgi:hypothetical protein